MSERLVSGHQVAAVSQEWLEEVKQFDQNPFHHGVVRIMPEGWLYPGTAPSVLDKIQSFEFKSDDVIVMTFPKSGTTWMQEIVWTMIHNPDLNNAKGDEALLLRSPDIGMDMIFEGMNLSQLKLDTFGIKLQELCPGGEPEEHLVLQVLGMLPGPRVIKNHFPLSLLPLHLLNKVKIVYVARNPKDVIVSYYQFWRAARVHSYGGTLEKWTKQFMDGDLFYTPYWVHLQQAWEARHHPNLHFVFYEEMKADIKAELKKLSDFLGTSLNQQQIDNVAEHTSFPAMKARGEPLEGNIFNKDIFEKQGGFFRQGFYRYCKGEESAPSLNDGRTILQI